MFSLVLMLGGLHCYAADAAPKLDESYTIKGTSITISGITEGTVGRQINNAIDYAWSLSQTDGKVYTVTVPAGSYNLERTIHVYGNIKLVLTDVTLTYTASSMSSVSGNAYGNMLMFGDSEVNTDPKIMSGYGTYSDITVVGGTFVGMSTNTSSLVRMAHCSNVTFDSSSFDGGGCAHQVEVSAIDGFTMKNCVFQNMKGNGSDEKQEALQLDIPCADYVFGGTVLDGTPMKNISVTGCTFSNVPRGVGSHSMITGYYFENVDISNNTFVNVAEEAIIALNYINCTIENNTITDCGAGILFQTFKPDVKGVYSTVDNGNTKVSGTIINDTNSVIANNKITIVSSKAADESVGIKVYGYNLEKDTRATGIGAQQQNSGVGDLIKAANYYVENVTVKNNKITTCGHGIHLEDAYNCEISSNTITSTEKAGKDAHDGIMIEFASKNITVSGNTIEKAARYAILVQNSSKVSSITGNTIKKSSNYAISLYNGSSVTGKISKNKISGTKNNAIIVNAKSSVKEISGNKITNTTGKGIYIYDSSSVTGKVTGNTIATCSDSGIKVEKKSSVKEISDNTITDTKERGIMLHDSATVTGQISGNTIKSAKKEGININSANNDFTVIGNTISGCKSWPIIMNNVSTKYTITFTGNTVTSSKNYAAIQIAGGKAELYENTLKKGKWAACFAKGAKGAVGYNTFSNNSVDVYMILGTKATGTKAVSSVTMTNAKATAAKNGMKLSWSAVKGAKNYTIEYSTSKDFSSDVVTITSKKASASISGLKSKTTYYVRICANSTVNGVTVGSDCSKVLTVKTK
jgi:parallel beta-helix repeat protein